MSPLAIPSIVLAPTVACHAAIGRGRWRLPTSGTERRSSVTSSPDGIRRWTGSADTVPASTTTLTVTMSPPSRARDDTRGHRHGRRRGCPYTRCVDPVVFEVADGVTAIDTLMGGRERYTAGYLLDAAEPTLIETGPGTSVEPVAAALAHLGIGTQELAHVVLTHIHLDHAGGAGALSARFPRATVWVHERGAPHLADPTRLVASTARVWGEAEMRELFGPTQAVDAERLRPVH